MRCPPSTWSGGSDLTWATQADFEAWFETSVKPALPEGGRGPMPSITFDELNEIVKA